MEKNNLYVLILILGAALGVTYVSKTKGGIDKIFAPSTKAPDGWMKDDPGWDRMPRTDPAPTTPTTPPATPPATPPTTPPQSPPRQQPRQQPPRMQPG